VIAPAAGTGDLMEIISSERFRHVLGHLPTGVTVITAMVDGRPVGMAANSVTSVSLEPPLLLVCPAKSSTTWPEIRAARRFCVNVMAGHHEALSLQFSQRGVDRFANVPWHQRQSGPALDEAVAWIDCETHVEHDAGDHTIAVASVNALDIGLESGEREVLIFYRGRYGRFSGIRN
jgi:3-hydroxy-9,10-secoandrosta-1,3,5(10)-triene-9,17-dione monooxygenase reductase component